MENFQRPISTNIRKSKSKGIEFFFKFHVQKAKLFFKNFQMHIIKIPIKYNIQRIKMK